MELPKIDLALSGKAQTRSRKAQYAAGLFRYLINISNRNYVNLRISAAARKDLDNAGYVSHAGPASRTCQSRHIRTGIIFRKLAIRDLSF
jgi:hypothetical protein